MDALWSSNVQILCLEPVTISTGYRHHVSQASLSIVLGTASAEGYYLEKQMLPHLKARKPVGITSSVHALS